jgi:hypothetical protein
MTHEEALAEVKRRQASDPDVTWIATQRGSEWTVARIGMAPRAKQTRTATKPPPVAPRDDLRSPLERAPWNAGGA